MIDRKLKVGDIVFIDECDVTREPGITMIGAPIGVHRVVLGVWSHSGVWTDQILTGSNISGWAIDPAMGIGHARNGIIDRKTNAEALEILKSCNFKYAWWVEADDLIEPSIVDMVFGALQSDLALGV